MRHLLNTLYVTSEDAYLSLDGENVVVNREKEVIARFPLHTLEGILCFSYAGASPALMGACVERNVNLVFLSPHGRFLARCSGESNGNVLLRREQYRVADTPEKSVKIARSMIFGKVYNARQRIERMRRDHKMRVDDAALCAASDKLGAFLPQILDAESPDVLRGLEGVSANAYFTVFDEMILNSKDDFRFQVRSRRPPLNNVNALLSFAYMLLAKDCAAALESVGMDSFVGFLHTDRPGRQSLALDLMEELRPCLADRFVLSLINNRKIHGNDFERQENGAVRISDEGRKLFLRTWQEQKKAELTHPFLKEKIPWGLVPYVQAQLLSRYLREDLDAYPPFLWK